MQHNPIPDYYPYVTRRLLELFQEGALTNIDTVDVEPDYGYVARITYNDGSHRITYGNDLGINAGAACDLAKDKGHSKFVLRAIGVNCPEGEEFLLPNWAEQVQSSPRQASNAQIRTTADAGNYIQEHIGYPVYIKPIDGSKGANIFKVDDPQELASVFDTYDAKKIRVAVVERPINMPDYRIVVLDGHLISAYQRIPLAVVGDGKRTISGLINALQAEYLAEGRDTKLASDDMRIITHLGKLGLSVDSIPSSEETIALLPISNLSAGGTSKDVSASINQRWVELAAYIAQNFNLRLCGLDLACKDITDASSPYSVLEVNASPGLDHYASSGEAQRKIVDELYTKVLNTHP